MSGAALALAAAEAAGVRVVLDGNSLVLDADAPPPPGVLRLLAENKRGIVALLRSERRGPELSSPAEPEATAISPAAVRAAYEAIVARLIADHGRPPDAARAGALDLLRVELRRDPRLIPPQPDPLRCAVCGEGERSWRPLVAVCTGMPDEYRWLHGGECHERYRARLTALVDATLASAGLIEPAPMRVAAE